LEDVNGLQDSLQVFLDNLEANQRYMSLEEQQYSLLLQQKLLETASSFSAITIKNMDDSIRSSLEDIGRCTGVDRVYIFSYDFSNHTYCNIYEWCEDSISPEISNLQNQHIDEVSQWVDFHVQGKSIYIPDVQSLPDGNIREILASQEIKSLLTVPIMDGAHSFGFIGLDAVVKPRTFSKIEQHFLRCYGQFFLNVYSRIQAEKQLYESEQKLASVLETQYEMICRFLPDTTLTFVNKAYSDMFGYEGEELIGKRFLDFIPRNEQDAVMEYIRSLSAENPSVTYTHSTFMQNGEKRWQEWTDRVILDENNNIIEYQSTGRDITAQKQAELALQNTNNLLKRITDNLFDIISITDPEGNITFINKSIERYGYSPEWVIGKNIKELLHPEDIKKTYSYITDFPNNPDDYHPHVSRFMTRDGRYVWVESVITLLTDKEGKTRELLITSRDITEKKDEEAYKKKLQKKLFETQKFEAIGRLAGGIAHEFNNLIAVIKGSTEMVIASMKDEQPALEFLYDINKATDRAEIFTKQLIAYAQRQNLLPKIIDLNIVIEQMLELLDEKVGENISIEWLPGKNLRKVRMDIAQVEEILVQLCTNAREAIRHSGTIRIETKGVTIDKDSPEYSEDFITGSYVVLSVIDTGCGIDEAFYEKLFDPFFSTRDITHSKGLGLSTVYGIVKQNNGCIRISSKKDKGTNVMIYLPAVE